jgi:hypothetical protein
VLFKNKEGDMTKENLGIVLWTIQMQVEEQMLKPMEKLFHNGYSNNVRFFGGGAKPGSAAGSSSQCEKFAIRSLIRRTRDKRQYKFL